MRHASLTLVTLASVLALAACGKKEKPAADPAKQARTVNVVRVEQRAIQGTVAASGDLVPREEAAVLPEVNGYRVTRVLADAGDYVRKGETLAVLDPALLEAQVAQARAQAAQADDEARRVAGLDNQGVLSQEQIAARRFQAQVANANLKNLLTQKAKLSVTAPVSGLVLEKTVRPGDSSSTGATPWFRLARDGQIELQAQLNEDDLSRVRVGQRAQVSLPSGARVSGVVRLVSPQIDAQNKLGFVRVTLPVRQDVRAGGFARAEFESAGGASLAVPETAIRYDADAASLMVVGPDNRVKRVVVRAGLRGNGLVQLIQGPPAGSVIVENAAAFLLDGDRVNPVQGGAQPAAKSAQK